MRKVLLFTAVFATISVFAQNWKKDGNGIPERVAVNEFIVLDNILYACGHYISEQFTSEVRIYKSDNNGANWEQVATPGLETLTGNAIFDYKGSFLSLVQ